jgi:hypothetical protein
MHIFNFECRGEHRSSVDFALQNPSPQSKIAVIFLQKIRKRIFFGGRAMPAPTERSEHAQNEK